MEKEQLYTKIDAYDRLINLLENKVKSLEERKINFGKKNRNHFKKLYPKINTFYTVNPGWKEERYRLRDQEGVIYFKATSFRFSPSRDLVGYGDNRPIVKGNFYDCNMKILDTYEEDIPIIHLSEIKKEKGFKYYQNKITSVYVMIDKNTGYYKIGRSINPKFREKTLQSEKPTIEMIFCREAFVKDEKVLHDKFSDKRIRGEWFDLSGSDLNYIKEYFN